MNMTDQVTIYENPQPLLLSRQAIFPGVVQLADGELLAMFTIGQAFDSADQRIHTCKSKDNGRSWSIPKPLHNHVYQPFQQSESFKPLLLADGTLLATGYVFVRPNAKAPIVDPVTLDLLTLKNMVSRSNDGGQSWSVPQQINIEGAQLEMSGPCIQLASGRIIGAAAPFYLGNSGHAGWIISSDDNGQNWQKLSEFFGSDNGEIAPWECRLVEMDAGNVAVLFWAYDTKNQRNLTNHIVFSGDAGATFGAAIDTGIQAQASNLLWLGDDRLLTIHAHREAPVGLVVRQINVGGNGFQVENEFDMFSDNSMGSGTKNIAMQFGSLKFGQPALIHLQTGEIMATCWKFENDQHIIKSYFLEL